MTIETSIAAYYERANRYGGSRPPDMHDFLIRMGHEYDDVIEAVVQEFDGLDDEADALYIKQHGILL